MNYNETIKKLEDSKYLIGMVSVDDILRFGYSMELNKKSRVLDLCCGYGTVLKLWSEEYGISGKGVDQYDVFVKKGQERLRDSNNERIELICGDVTTYEDNEKYDVVICSETIESIEYTIQLGEKFLKPGGILVFHKLYAKVPNVPQELIDFDGKLHTLTQLQQIFQDHGYGITHMASGSNSEFERYVMQQERNFMQQVKENPKDEGLRQWAYKWNYMYFEYRRNYEEQALIGLTKLK